MSAIFVLQLFTGTSILLSVIYFVVSTIYLDDVGRHTSSYGHPNVLAFVTGLSVWLSMFQFGTCFLIFKRLDHTWKFWCLHHLFTFCLTVIIFSVAMSEQAHKIGGSTGNAFVGFSAIEFIFASVSSCIIFLLGRQDAFSPGY